MFIGNPTDVLFAPPIRTSPRSILSITGQCFGSVTVWALIGFLFCALMSLAWGYVWFVVEGTAEVGIGFLISVIGTCGFGARIWN